MQKDLNKIIVAHLNINSLRNKLEFLIQKIEAKIDIFKISETKHHESFPGGQFFIKDFSTPLQLEIATEVVFLCILKKTYIQNFYL